MTDSTSTSATLRFSWRSIPERRLGHAVAAPQVHEFSPTHLSDERRDCLRCGETFVHSAASQLQLHYEIGARLAVSPPYCGDCATMAPGPYGWLAQFARAWASDLTCEDTSVVLESWARVQKLVDFGLLPNALEQKVSAMIDDRRGDLMGHEQTRCQHLATVHRRPLLLTSPGRPNDPTSYAQWRDAGLTWIERQATNARLELAVAGDGQDGIALMGVHPVEARVAEFDLDVGARWRPIPSDQLRWMEPPGVLAIERWGVSHRKIMLRLVLVGAAATVSVHGQQLLDSCVVELRVSHSHFRIVPSSTSAAAHGELRAPCLIPGVLPGAHPPWRNAREPKLGSESKCVRCKSSLPSPGFRAAEVRDGLWRYRAECVKCGDWIPQAWLMQRCHQCGQLLAVAEQQANVDCVCGALVAPVPALARRQHESPADFEDIVFRFPCPHCREECLCESKVAGQRSVCPHCFLPMAIPLGGERIQASPGDWTSAEWHCGVCGQAVPKAVDSCPFCDSPNQR